MAKYPKNKKFLHALNPRNIQKIHRELHDFDYLDKLSDEEKEFLARFIDETIASNWTHDGNDLYPYKKGAGDENPAKWIVGESNARRRCLATALKEGFLRLPRQRPPKEGEDPKKKYYEWVKVPVRGVSLDEPTRDESGGLPFHEYLGSPEDPGLVEDAMIEYLDRDKEKEN